MLHASASKASPARKTQKSPSATPIVRDYVQGNLAKLATALRPAKDHRIAKVGGGILRSYEYEYENIRYVAIRDCHPRSVAQYPGEDFRATDQLTPNPLVFQPQTPVAHPRQSQLTEQLTP
jgi:hypothetical protein